MLDFSAIDWGWLSAEWFTATTLKSFEWKFFPVLYALPLPWIIILFHWVISKKRKMLTVAAEPDAIKTDAITFLRFIPDVLIALAISFMLVALARPQRTFEKTEQFTEGIDIVLTVDVSRSMILKDLLPNRLEAAKKTTLEFIKGRKDDRIGLVVFSGEAFSLAPLTTDYALLSDLVESIDFNMISVQNTAIGSALGISIIKMEESLSNSKVIILLSDGDSNAGNMDPLSAAQLAKANGIRLYTISIGKKGKIPYGKDAYGQTQYFNNEPDESTLRQIATIGEGKFYQAGNNTSLKQIFEEIDQLEKVKVKETRYRNTSDFYDRYLKWALLFFLLWLFSKGSFMSNLLQD